MLRLPWPLRIVLALAAAGFGIWAHSHHTTSHTWMEGELRKAIDAQIAPQTVNSVHCTVSDPSATCTFVVSGQTYRQHFHRDDSTWTPADQATPVSR